MRGVLVLLLKRLGILLVYYTLLFTRTAHGAISYGKLKIKVQTDHSTLDGRSTVVATRDNSFLNKDGDIFKLHKPAILKDSLSDTISFESLRYPGHFLKASINKGVYNFRLEKPDDTYRDDDTFNKTASFLIQRNTGVRGSGMLRMMEDPSYYMCVDTDGNKPTLRAMKDDNTVTRSSLKEKCSFYIQKLRPLKPVKPLHSSMTNTSLPVVALNNLKKKAADNMDPATLKDGLQRLASSLEGTGDVAALHAINAVIHHFQSASTPSPDNIRRLLNDYEDKIRTIQNDDRGRIPPSAKTSKKMNPISELHATAKVTEATAKPEPSAKTEPTKANKKVNVEEEAPARTHETKMANVLYNPSPQHPSYIPFNSRSLSVKKDTRKAYVRRKTSASSLLHPKDDELPAGLSLRNNTLSLMRSLLPLFDPARIPSLDFANIDGPLKNDTIQLTKTMLQYLYPQASPVSAEPNGHPAELTKMGPYPPINLGDFSKQTHREPSLNIDGLVSSISVPQTFSNTSTTTTTNNDDKDKHNDQVTMYYVKTNNNTKPQDPLQEKNVNENTIEHDIRAITENVKEVKEVKAVQEFKQAKEVKEVEEVKAAKEVKEVQEVKEVKEVKEAKEAKVSPSPKNVSLKDSPDANIKTNKEKNMTGDDVTNMNDPLLGNSTLSDVPESTDIKPEEEVKVNSKPDTKEEAKASTKSEDMKVKPESEPKVEETKASTKSEDMKVKSESEPKVEETKETKTNVKPAEETKSEAKAEEPKAKAEEPKAKAEEEPKKETKTEETKTVTKPEETKETKDTIKPEEHIKVNPKPEESSNLKPNSSVDSPPFEDVQPDDFVKAMFENTSNKTTDDKNNNQEATKAKEGAPATVENKGGHILENTAAEGGVARNSSKDEESTKAPTSDSSDPLKELVKEKEKDVKDVKVASAETAKNTTGEQQKSNASASGGGDGGKEKIYNYSDDEQANLKNINTVFGNNDAERAAIEKEINDNLFKGANKTSSTGENSTTTNASSVNPPMNKAGIERVEFAKEIEHVEIAVGNKGEMDNVTKPVLAKSYVKDHGKDGDKRSKNNTHTIDGNFIVKYDEPLSESTTREIANNIFKAVFNTLNKTTLPSGAMTGASNGVERATIEKFRKVNKNMLTAPLERIKNSEDGVEGIPKDKITTAEDVVPTHEHTDNNYNLKVKHIVSEHGASAIHNDSVGENVVSVVENVLKGVVERSEGDEVRPKGMVEGRGKLKPSPDAPLPVELSRVKNNSTSAGKETSAVTQEPHAGKDVKNESSASSDKQGEKEKKVSNDDAKNTKTPMPSTKLTDAKDASNLKTNTTSSTQENNTSSEHKLSPTHDDEAQLQPEREKEKESVKDEKPIKAVNASSSEKQMIHENPAPEVDHHKETSGITDESAAETDTQKLHANPSPDSDHHKEAGSEATPAESEAAKVHENPSPDTEHQEGPKVHENPSPDTEHQEGPKVHDNPSPDTEHQEEHHQGAPPASSSEAAPVSGAGGEKLHTNPSPQADHQPAHHMGAPPVAHAPDKPTTLSPDTPIVEAVDASSLHANPAPSDDHPDQPDHHKGDPIAGGGGAAVGTPDGAQSAMQNPKPDHEHQPMEHLGAPAVTAGAAGFVGNQTVGGGLVSNQTVGGADAGGASPTGGAHSPTQRHTNHIITVKDDNEKEALLNKLVNYDYDKCVFMKLINDIKSPYRLISSVNRHGYKPRGLVFTLKTVLKDPDLHQFVAFRAIDENDPKRVITLDGQRDLVAVPVLCHGSPRVVHVESQQPPKAIATAMARILSETRHADKTDQQKKHSIPLYTSIRGRKKHNIPYPQPKIPVPRSTIGSPIKSPLRAMRGGLVGRSEVGAKTASSFLNFAKKTGSKPTPKPSNQKPPAKAQKSVVRSSVAAAVTGTMIPAMMYGRIPYGGYQQFYSPGMYFKRSVITAPTMMGGQYLPVEAQYAPVELGY